MKKVKKLTALFLSFTMAASLLAGCSGNKGNTTDKGGEILQAGLIAMSILVQVRLPIRKTLN